MLVNEVAHSARHQSGPSRHSYTTLDCDCITAKPVPQHNPIHRRAAHPGSAPACLSRSATTSACLPEQVCELHSQLSVKDAIN